MKLNHLIGLFLVVLILVPQVSAAEQPNVFERVLIFFGLMEVQGQAVLDNQTLQSALIKRTATEEIYRIHDNTYKNILYSNIQFIQDENGDYQELTDIVNFTHIDDETYQINYWNGSFNITQEIEIDGKKEKIKKLKDNKLLGDAKIDKIIKKEGKDYKFGANISDINDTYKNKVTAFYYKVEGGEMISNGRFKLKDGIIVDFAQDLEERGFTVETNGTEVKVGNLTGKKDLDLDPTITLDGGAGINGDTYVRSGTSTTNYGNNIDMEAGYPSAGGSRRGIMEWSLSSLPSNAQNVHANMTLNIHAQNNGNPITYGVYETHNDSWVETSITWDDNPCGSTIGSVLGTCNSTAFLSFSTGTTSNQDDIGFNLTNGINKFLSNDTDEIGNWSFMIKDLSEAGSGSRKDFNTKEDATSTDRPILEITYSLDLPDITAINLNSSALGNTTNENLTAFATADTGATFVFDWFVNNSALSFFNLPMDYNDTTIRDYSKLGNNATQSHSNMQWVYYGRSGGAFNFSGSDSYLVSSIAMADRPTENYSASVWFRTLDNGTTQSIFENNLGGTSGFWAFKGTYIQVDSTGVMKYSIPASGGFCCSIFSALGNQSVTTGEWHHAAFTYTNSTGELKGYLDGVLDATLTGGGNLDWGEDNFYIGVAWNATVDNYINEFNGTIDELILFDIELTQEQINSIYQAGLIGEKMTNITSSETSVGEVWSFNVTGVNETNGIGPTNNSNTLTILAGAADSCSYSSGDWLVDCSDNCEINSTVDVGGNDIFITGTGYFQTSADISNYGKLHIRGTDSSNKCIVRCVGGCFR